ncbi:coagulation factor IX [Halyomorpha halys]|uniref:coagulation factor IX n=1 Tax=Halyomorpha halys TaxID=286706 RepID=UPI0006D4CBEF|nr:modular serine protease-like [Halyomorpha halys]XP_014285959.1 modular serine protease-like [Halyomorpha halys]XP_014285960.1 modular serine protease-like [Halyomorpha halys]
MRFLFLSGIYYTVFALSEVREKRQANCNRDGQFLCPDGNCIDDIYVCDGYSDCYDFYLPAEQRPNVTADESISLCINKRCPKFTFKCAYGACIDKEKKCDGHPDCYDKSDEDEELCRQHLDVRNTIRSSDGNCEVFSSPNLILNCSRGGYPVSCKLPAIKGTKMVMRCKNGFHKQNHNSFTVETTCLDNGNWSPPPHDDCTVCGRRYRIGDYVPLISYAKKANYLEYPWHAGLYEVDNNGTTYLCGGSIIHPKAILTAAHCVYDEAIDRLAEKTYFVAVGKYNSSWLTKDSLEERIKVKKVNIKVFYRGVRNRYEHDIAILELDHEIQFHPAVSAVCIDWNKDLLLYLNTSALGTIVGWGNTENNVTSELLRIAKLRFYDFQDCRSKSEKDFETFITADKICAGLGNDTIVQQGDSGGGLTYARQILNYKEENYIYGIVSIKDKSSNKLAAFTQVTVYIDWIEETLNSIIERDLKRLKTST